MVTPLGLKIYTSLHTVYFRKDSEGKGLTVKIPILSYPLIYIKKTMQNWSVGNFPMLNPLLRARTLITVRRRNKCCRLWTAMTSSTLKTFIRYRFSLYQIFTWINLFGFRCFNPNRASGCCLRAGGISWKFIMN